MRGRPGHRPWTRLECIAVHEADSQHFAEFSLCLSHRTGFCGRRRLRMQTGCYEARHAGIPH